MEDKLDLGYRVLDVQLVDVDGRRCGRVDDVELRGAPGEPLRVTAVLTGRGLFAARLPRCLRRIGERVFGPAVLGRTVTRVPWESVEDVEATVTLRRNAADLDLALVDRELEPIMRKLPGG